MSYGRPEIASESHSPPKTCRQSGSQWDSNPTHSFMSPSWIYVGRDAFNASSYGAGGPREKVLPPSSRLRASRRFRRRMQPPRDNAEEAYTVARPSGVVFLAIPPKIALMGSLTWTLNGIPLARATGCPAARGAPTRQPVHTQVSRQANAVAPITWVRCTPVNRIFAALNLRRQV